MGRSSLQKNKRRLRIDNEGYYGFDDAAGSTAPTDSSGNARTLSATTIVASSPTPLLGTGCIVGGSTGGAITGLSIPVTNFSVSLWFQFISTASVSTATHLISKSGGNVLTIAVRRNTADVVVTPLAQTAITSSAVSTSAWHHLVVVVENITTTVYIDNAIIGTSTNPVAATLTGWTFDETAKVACDSASVFSRALSPAGIDYLYQTGLGFNPYSVSA